MERLKLEGWKVKREKGKKVEMYKVVKRSCMQKLQSNQQSTDFSKLSLDKQCPVARTKCGRTSKNSWQANEALDLRALALDRAAVQATIIFNLSAILQA